VDVFVESAWCANRGARHSPLSKGKYVAIMPLKLVATKRPWVMLRTAIDEALRKAVSVEGNTTLVLCERGRGGEEGLPLLNSPTN